MTFTDDQQKALVEIGNAALPEIIRQLKSRNVSSDQACGFLFYLIEDRALNPDRPDSVSHADFENYYAEIEALGYEERAAAEDMDLGSN